jgi:glutaredoxin
MGGPVIKVEFFALSTCGWCRKTREWLDERRVAYQLIYLDQVSGEEKESAKGRILQFTERLSFPLIVINDGQAVIQGYQPEKFQEILG